MEQFDEGVVWHVVSRIGQLFPLRLHIVVLVVFVVAVVGLCLQRWTFRIRVQIVHIREAHASELVLIFVLGDVDLTIFAGVVVGEGWEWRHFTAPFDPLQSGLPRQVLFVFTHFIAIVVDVAKTLGILCELRPEKLLNCFHSTDLNPRLRILRLLLLHLHFLVNSGWVALQEGALSIVVTTFHLATFAADPFRVVHRVLTLVV